MHGALAFAEGTADLAHTISVYDGGNYSTDCAKKVRYFKKKCGLLLKIKILKIVNRRPTKHFA